MLYLEDFLELIEQLPSELRDRFTEMREMDLQVQNSLDKNDEAVKMFFRNAPYLVGEERQRQAEKIRQEYLKSLDVAGEKVNLADTMEDLVQRFLRKLDSELAKFKVELEADNPGVTEQLEKKVVEAEEAANRNKRERRKRTARVGDNAATKEKHANAASADGETTDTPSCATPKLADAEQTQTRESKPSHSNSSEDATPLETKQPSTSHLTELQPSSTSLSSTHSAGPSVATGSTDVPARRQSVPSRLAEYRTLSMGEGQYLTVIHQPSTPTRGGSSPPLGGSPGSLSASSSAAQSAFLHAFQSGGGDTRGSRPRKLNSRVGEMLKEVVHRQEQREAAAAVTGMPPVPSGSPFGGASSSGVTQATSSEDETSDPNEPRYCICNQVSYGEMVACDNKGCPFEWFHYACVGITQPPKGKWYCPQCTAAMRRRASRLVPLQQNEQA